MKSSNKDPNAEIKKNMGMYILFFPIIGLLVSIFITILFYIQKKEWSLYVLLWLILYTSLHLILYILFHKWLDIDLFFLRGKRKYISLGLILLLTLLNKILFF